MKRLIVNADGFGFGDGATRGIIDAIARGGFITSVSINANFPAAMQAVELTRRFPRISIGVHVNPIVGSPCLPPERIPSLVDASGSFHGSKFLSLLRKGKIVGAELELELGEQIAVVKKMVGANLTHLDSHQNSHLHYFGVFRSLARKWGIARIRNNASLICLESSRPSSTRLSVYATQPAVLMAHTWRRVQMNSARRAGLRMADRLITVGYGGNGKKDSRANWEAILGNLPHGTFEIYCHPAYPDDTLRQYATYVEQREKELEILSDPELPRIAANRNIQLVSFHEI
jgi:chitin disaccharide deacetylase